MKYNVLRRITAFIAALAVSVSFMCVGASAKTPKYSDPKPLPKLTGDYRKDFVAVAKSQLGYKEASDGSSCFGAWNGEPYQDWCSEFVAWCAEKAEIPFWVFPKLCSCKRYRDYYAPRGMCYYLKEGIDPKKYDYLEDYDNIGYISVDDLKAGDIIIENSGKVFYNPNHTSIFLEYKDGELGVISGNCNDCVMEHTTELREVYCVVRPDYDVKNPVPARDLNDIRHWAEKYPITANYTGDEAAPEITIYDKEINYDLVEGKDYTVTLKNAVNVGNASAVYKGKGAYTGSFTIDYKVVKPSITISSEVLEGGKIKLKWNKIDGAERYIVYRSENGGKTFKKVVTLDSSRTYGILKYDKNKSYTYYVKVRVKPKSGASYYIQSNNLQAGKGAPKSTVVKDDDNDIIIIYPKAS